MFLLNLRIFYIRLKHARATLERLQPTTSSDIWKKISQEIRYIERSMNREHKTFLKKKPRVNGFERPWNNQQLLAWSMTTVSLSRFNLIT